MDDLVRDDISSYTCDMLRKISICTLVGSQENNVNKNSVIFHLRHAPIFVVLQFSLDVRFVFTGASIFLYFSFFPSSLSSFWGDRGRVLFLVYCFVNRPALSMPFGPGPHCPRISSGLGSSPYLASPHLRPGPVLPAALRLRRTRRIGRMLIVAARSVGIRVIIWPDTHSSWSTLRKVRVPLMRFLTCSTPRIATQ